MSGFDKFNNLRKRDIAAEKGIEAKWDSRFIPFIALSEPGSLGSQPASNVFIRRRGVDIARDFAVDAVKTGELKEVRLLQMDRIFVSKVSGAATLIAPSRASPLRGPCRNAGVEEKRRAAGSFDGGGKGKRSAQRTFLKVIGWWE